MTPEQRAAYIFAQAIAAMAEIEAMKAANTKRAYEGYSQDYSAESFVQVIDRYGISHNAILALFGE